MHNTQNLKVEYVQKRPQVLIVTHICALVPIGSKRVIPYYGYYNNNQALLGKIRSIYMAMSIPKNLSFLSYFYNDKFEVDSNGNVFFLRRNPRLIAPGQEKIFAFNYSEGEFLHPRRTPENL